MEQATHERLRRGEVLAPGSDRAFGLVMAAAFALISLASWWYAGAWWPWTGGLALLFLVCALGHPPLLKPLNRAWFRLGLVLHAVINPIVMGLIFFLAVTPTGWIMRARGKDLLRLRREPDSESYWIVRNPPGPAPETLKDQF
jgi:large-conductance mechanosensitive channel